MLKLDYYQSAQWLGTSRDSARDGSAHSENPDEVKPIFGESWRWPKVLGGGTANVCVTHHLCTTGVHSVSGTLPAP